jgi:ABC-type dipeptide/oligopeptide/nickel transport system ATPase subunit
MTSDSLMLVKNTSQGWQRSTNNSQIWMQQVPLPELPNCWLVGGALSRAGTTRLLTCVSGLGFDENDQKKQTKSFSGGWRMRLALARALFVKVSKAKCSAIRPCT